MIQAFKAFSELETQDKIAALIVLYMVAAAIYQYFSFYSDDE